MGFISYAQINILDEFSFIGGSDYTLEFTVLDQNGSPVDLTGATCTLKIAPYGQHSIVVATINGIVSLPNTVTYVIPSATSLSLEAGKYMYQPIIVDTVPKTYRPAQGVFVITPGIG